MPGKRLYNDQEISTVLKQAAAMQRKQGPTDTTGLSLEELQQVAADAGIDPAYVRAAAERLDDEADDPAFHVLGGPTAVERERVVDGAVTPEGWEEAVAEIRRTFGAAGEVSRVGRSLEWVLRDVTGERSHVTLTPVGERTRIRIFTRTADWAVAVHAPVLSFGLAMVILQFILLRLGPLLEIGVAVLVFTAAFMIARALYGALTRRQDQVARKLMNRLEDLVTGTGTEEAAASSPPLPEGRIDASLFTDDVEAPHSASTGRRLRAGGR